MDGVPSPDPTAAGAFSRAKSHRPADPYHQEERSMAYTRKPPALLIMGAIVLAIGGLASSGNLDSVIA